MTIQNITAQTGSPFAQDPAISLKFLLGADNTTTPAGQWGSAGASSSLPLISTVNIDTKWGPSGMHNRILIENFPRIVKYQVIGGVRTRTWDIKRVQVWCDTKNAVQNKWLIEEEIKRIVNGFKLGLQSVGIDEMIFERGFEDIEIEEPGVSGEVGKGGYLARSDCLIKLIYDEILVTS